MVPTQSRKCWKKFRFLRTESYLMLFLCRFPSQQSSPVQLVKGKIYYMEALMKEGGGGDHITVGVKLPSGTLQRPISQEDIYIRPPPGMTCTAMFEI